MFLSSLRELKRIRGITVCALLIALYVVLNSIGIYITPTVKFTFTYLPLAVMGMLLGPSAAFIGAGLADFLAYFLRPNPAPIHFGIVLTNMLTGLVFGLFLYRREVKLWRAIASKAVINIFLNLLLNTYWLAGLYGEGYLAMLPARLGKNLILLPLEVALIFLILKTVQTIDRRNHIL